MGIKYTDILMKNHDHDRFMKYMRFFQFKEFFEDEVIGNYKVKEETFPMQKILEIDSHEIYSWECDIEDGDKFYEYITLETNASVPWVRIALREAVDIDPDDWAEKLSLAHPEADVSVLSYYSVSDYSFVRSYRKGKIVRSVSFDFESKPQIQWAECEDRKTREP